MGLPDGSHGPTGSGRTIVVLHSKAPIKSLLGGFGYNKLVLYGIRLLAKQFLGTILIIEVDQSATKGIYS